MNINVLSPDTQIVGDKDITILEANPINRIKIVNKAIFLLSNKRYKDIIINKNVVASIISGIHVIREEREIFVPVLVKELGISLI